MRQVAPSAGVREFGVLATSTILLQGSRLLFSLAAADTLSPSAFTSWTLLLALLIYAPSLLLGVVNGMSREVPVLVGAGRPDRATEVVHATWTATYLVSAGVLAIAAIAAILRPDQATSIAVVGLLVAATIWLTVQQFILRSSLRFGTASLQQGILGVLLLSASAAVILARVATLPVLAGAYLACLMIAIAAVVMIVPPSLRSVAGHTIVNLAQIGWPIMSAGLAFSVLVTLDRWVATAMFGPAAAAPYAFAGITAAAMLMMPTVVSQQTYPRMAMEHGRGASSSQLLSMARRQGEIAAALSAATALAVITGALIVIPLALQEFSAALPIIAILSVGLVAQSLFTGFGNYLNVVGGQWRYLGVQLVSIALALGLTIVGASVAGVTGIAGGMAVAYALYGVLLREMAIRTLPRSDAADVDGRVS